MWYFYWQWCICPWYGISRSIDASCSIHSVTPTHYFSHRLLGKGLHSLFLSMSLSHQYYKHKLGAVLLLLTTMKMTSKGEQQWLWNWSMASATFYWFTFTLSQIKIDSWSCQWPRRGFMLMDSLILLSFSKKKFQCLKWTFIRHLIGAIYIYFCHIFSMCLG